MNETLNSRKTSFFYQMRRFHNDIKRTLINKYAKNVNRLLDLACGKGGDIQKWRDNKIKYIVGYDINEKSILEGKNRLKEFNMEKNVKLDIKNLSIEILYGNNDFDVVTCMFAFHYFFENDNTFNTIISSIENNLKQNGYFLGTFFDGNCVRNYNNKHLDHFKLEIKNDTPDNLFGNKVSVQLKETVLNECTDEYIVDFNKLKIELEKRGFKLIETKLFSDIYKEKQHKFPLNEIEKDVSFLNRFFVFQKIN